MRPGILLTALAVAAGSLFGSRQSLAFNAYITNQGSNTVSVIDTVTDTVVDTIQVASGPFSVAVLPDGSKAYITSPGSNTVSVIDTATNKVTTTVAVTSPEGAAVSPDGRLLYIASPPSQLVVIDTATNTVVSSPTAIIPGASGAFGVAVSTGLGSGGDIFVTNRLSGNLSISIVGTWTNFPLGVSAPAEVAVTPDGNTAYIANGAFPSVAAFSLLANMVGAPIVVGPTGAVFGVAVSPDGTKVYATWPNFVSIIDTATNTLTATKIPVGTNPMGLSVTPDGSKVFVANSGDGTVSVINTATNTVIDTIVVGINPQAFGNFISTQSTVKPAPPSGTACTGLYNGTFKGSITVSAGQDCHFISGGQITGNVALTGGNLGLSGVSVGGNVSITGGSYTLAAATIGSNLEILNLPAGNANNSVCGTEIMGNLRFNNNATTVQIGSPAAMTCAGNKIGGNVEALANSSSTLIFNNTIGKNLNASNNTGMLDVVGNKVGATLTCRGNTQLVMGGGNTAQKKVGQCN
jgi:YVTN family beta-propeller protein